MPRVVGSTTAASQQNAVCSVQKTIRLSVTPNLRFEARTAGVFLSGQRHVPQKEQSRRQPKSAAGPHTQSQATVTNWRLRLHVGWLWWARNPPRSKNFALSAPLRAEDRARCRCCCRC